MIKASNRLLNTNENIDKGRTKGSDVRFAQVKDSKSGQQAFLHRPMEGRSWRWGVDSMNVTLTVSTRVSIAKPKYRVSPRPISSPLVAVRVLRKTPFLLLFQPPQ